MIETCDPLTGEMVPASHLAIIYANATEERAELAAELRKLDAELADMRDALTAAAEHGPIDAGEGRKVVLKPPRRPSQRVIASGAERHREVLLDMGGARMESVFRPPNITWVRDHAAELVARGVPVDEIAPEPMAGPPSLEVVDVGA